MSDLTLHAYPHFPLRRFVNEITDGPFGSSLTSSHYSDGGARVVRLGNIGSARFKNSDAAFIPLDYFSELRRHEVKPGDLLIAGLGDERHPVGRACIAPDDLGFAIVKADCYRVRLDESRLTHRFAAWALSSSSVAEQVSSSTRGSTRSRINLEVAREILLPVPPVEEQRRIVDFLDAETARIENLDSKRAKQMAGLGERELALIADMLSGGVENGTGHLTGWPWLPEIPATWSIGPVYAYYATELGKMLNADRASGKNQRVYLRNANVHWYAIDTDDLATMDFAADEVSRYSVKQGDLLVCEGGAGVAEAAVWDGRLQQCYFQKSLHRVRQAGSVPVEWLMFWLRLAKACGAFEAEGNISTIPHLTGEQLRQYRIPIPVDGDSLVKRTGEAIRRLSAARTKLGEAQALLVERRTALITAAVTGQIDVSTASGRGIGE